MGKFKLLSCAFGVSFLLAGTALAQTDPNAHGPFDTSAGGNPAAPQGTPGSPLYVTGTTTPAAGSIQQVGPTATANSAGNPFFFTAVGGGSALQATKATGSDGGTPLPYIGYWYATAPAEASAAGVMQPKVDAYGATFVDGEGIKPVFTASFSVVPAVGGGVFARICPSSTKSVHVRQAFFQGIATTTASAAILTVNKTSTIGAGTATATPTGTPSSGVALGTAVVTTWTTSATAGTPIGSGLNLFELPLPLAASVVAPAAALQPPADDLQSIILAAAATQCVEFSLAANANANTILGKITWTEE